MPRRAGDRGAVDAGCLPNLLPGGRPVIDAVARAELGEAWKLKTGTISGSVGRDTDAIIAAAAAGKLGALVVAGVDPGDLSDPALAERALDNVDFLVSLEVRRSAVTERADVVFPVAPVVEKSGTFLDWEGRLRTFDTVLETTAVPDARVLDALASEMGVEIGCKDVNDIRRELRQLSLTQVDRLVAPKVAPATRPTPGAGGADPRDVAAADRRRPDARRRRHPPRHRPPGGAAAVQADRGRARQPRRRRSRHGVHRARVAHPAGGADRDARRRGLVADELARLRGAAGARGQLGGRRVGHPRGEGVMFLSQDALLAQDPTLADFGHDPWWLILIKIVVAFVFGMGMILLGVWFERRVVARMAVRPGLNQVGPLGLLQTLADGIKGMLKEDLLPRAADKVVFFFAPTVSAVFALTALAVVPFGPMVSIFGHRTPLQVTDVSVAVLVILACSAIGVYGIVLGGWASGSTYPLLGGLRSSAQMISYEVAMGLSIVAVFMTAGTMSTSAHRGGAGRWSGGLLGHPRLAPDGPVVVRDPAAAELRHLLHLGVRRDEPGAVRPARGRDRTRRRVHDRVQLDQVPALHALRVRGDGLDVGRHGHHVPRRVACALAD